MSFIKCDWQYYDLFGANREAIKMLRLPAAKTNKFDVRYKQASKTSIIRLCVPN